MAHGCTATVGKGSGRKIQWERHGGLSFVTTWSKAMSVLRPPAWF